MLSTQPGISLGVQVPQPAAAGGLAANPLGLINTLSELQLRMNQNALFQQTFMANQQMGQIMAGAPNIDAGIAGILRSPAAPFSGPFLNNLRSMDKTMLDISLAKAGAAQGVVQSYTKSLAAAYADPTMLPALRAMAMATAAPEAAGPAAAAIDSLNTALLDGVAGPATSGDPNQVAWAHKVFQNRVLGALTPQLDANVLRSMAGVVTPGVEQGPYGPGGAQMPFGVGGSIYGTPAVTGLPGGGATPANALASGATAGGPAALGVPSGLVAGGAGGLMGPSKTQAEYLAHRGADMADYQKRLDDTVTAGYGIQQTLMEARDALQNFKPGGGAEIYAGIARLAQALGASNTLVDQINRGDLGATQEFQKLMVQNVMGQIKEQLPTGSRLAQMEFGVFNKNNPNIETDSRAIEKIFNFYNRLFAQHIDEQNSMNTYLGRGGDISQWPATWQGLARQKGYVNVGSGAKATAEAPGTTGDTATPAYQEGQTATGPLGAKMIYRGGKWVPVQ